VGVEGVKKSAVEALEEENVRRHDEIKGLANLLLLLIPHQPPHLDLYPWWKLGLVQR
jgi:hypothetical protein